jgi:hypothetical protein
MCAIQGSSRVLDVGVGRTYSTPAVAARDAMPGDTILLYPGVYRGPFFLESITGRPDAWITLRGTNPTTCIIEGGSESLHLSDCSYMIIEDLLIRGQSSNGMNIDDAGSFDTPSHHIIIQRVAFERMNATGNNDFLKLSGLDAFVIDSCTFTDGSAGGSGIDMVGCHDGIIQRCRFERMGSNAIQAKGGTQHIRIERSTFIDAGQRAVNLGGSTGLAFFRPQDARFEAADLYVYSNIFVRSTAPVAFVGCIRVDVANNTIINPERWVFRVLQETVDTSRFAPCGQNMFRNNVIVMRSSLSTHINIGSNTDAGSFTVSSNLWFMSDNPARSKPAGVPWTESAGIYGVDPQFVSSQDFHLQPSSAAVQSGVIIDSLRLDLAGKQFGRPPSRGALEVENPTSVAQDGMPLEHNIVERVSSTHVRVRSIAPSATSILVYSIRGQCMAIFDPGHVSTLIPCRIDEFVVVQ